MAAGLLRKMLETDGTTAMSTIEVDSAGTSPAEGSAPAQVVEVMRGYGIDLTMHRPKGLSQGLVGWADLILTMCATHKAHILACFPQARGKTFKLTEFVGKQGDIPDPIGGGKLVHEQCARELDKLVQVVADKLVL